MSGHMIGGMATQMIVKSLLAGALSPASSDLRLRGFLLIASGILMAVTVVFLILAAHYWFMANYAADLATLMTAGVVFVLACMCMCVAWIIGLKRRSRIRHMQHELQTTFKSVMETLDDGVGQTVRENPLVSLAIAALAGYAVTDIAS